MQNRSHNHGWNLWALLAVLATACGCQSTRHDSYGSGVVGELQDRAPRSFALASYGGQPRSDRSAGSGQSPVNVGTLATGHESSFALSSNTLQDQPNSAPAQSGAPSGQGSDAQPKPAHERDLKDINNQLNNPGADIAQLNFKFTWNQFQGDLGSRRSAFRSFLSLRRGNPLRNLRHLRGLFSGGEGASSQNSLTMSFQPVFPFKLADGGHFIVRPSIPVTWKPHYNAASRGFDEDFGLGDIQIVAFYSRTDMKKGYMWGAGATMQIPTHTDDSLGKNQFLLGPAGFAGLLGKWGSAGLFPQHWWNVGNSDVGYTCITALQPWYWFNVGGGYQIGGSPIIEYNWAEDDSDEAWTVPVNLGLAKTTRIGKLPVKIKLEGIYYIVQPDSFGPQWGLQLTVTPVISNPFERHVAGK